MPLIDFFFSVYFLYFEKVHKLSGNIVTLQTFAFCLTLSLTFRVEQTLGSETCVYKAVHWGSLVFL